MRFFHFLLISILLATIESGYAQKKTIDLDSELEEELPEKRPENKIENDDVIVEGEDEKLIPSKKKKSSDLLPEENADAQWQKDADQIVKKEKQGVKKTEKRAQVKTEYGIYNSLGIDIYITKRDEAGIYLLDYSRSKADSNGFGKTIVGNSEHTIDNLRLVSGFNLVPEFKVFVEANYLDNLYGLQSNSNYSQQFKRGGVGNVSLQYRPSEFQRIDLVIGGQYLGSDLEISDQADPSATFSKASGDLKWQYIWGKRNSIYTNLNLWYGENDLYETDIKNTYRVGHFKAWDVFTLLRNRVGAEKIIWQVDLTFGFNIFFAKNMKSLPGPVLAIDSFLGDWHMKLELERESKIPDYVETVLTNPYFKPQQYSSPADLYRLALTNKVKITKDMALRITNRFLYYENYYDHILDSDLLYLYQPRLFRSLENEVAIEHSVWDNFYYDLGGTLAYQVDQVNLKSPYKAFLRSHYLPGSWHLSLELQYLGVRELDTLKLDGFFLLNASIERKLNQTISLFVRGENLFNESYLLAPPYDTSGTKGFFGLNILL